MLFVPFNDSSPTKLQIMIFCATNAWKPRLAAATAQKALEHTTLSAWAKISQPKRSYTAHHIHTSNWKKNEREERKTKTTAITTNTIQEKQKKDKKNHEHWNLTYAIRIRHTNEFETFLRYIVRTVSTLQSIVLE